MEHLLLNSSPSQMTRIHACSNNIKGETQADVSSRCIVHDIRASCTRTEACARLGFDLLQIALGFQNLLSTRGA
eukprot:6186354-Pleurochrysis_carterae.AAC.2